MCDETKNMMCEDCCECDCECDADQEFYGFAEYVASSYIEMWNAKYGGAFVDSNGDNIFIKRVIYSKPKVIVLWNDGTKSTSSCAAEDTFSIEAGLTIAVMNRIYGYDLMEQLFKDWLPNAYYFNADAEDTIVDISDVRRKYKEGYKIVDRLTQQLTELKMKEYLESCGYKVQKKK